MYVCKRSGAHFVTFGLSIRKPCLLYLGGYTCRLHAHILGENSLITNTYIPKAEFPEFINSLNLLAEMHLIKDFFHVVLTLVPHKRGGVPHEFFKDGAWTCSVENGTKKLKEIIDSS